MNLRTLCIGLLLLTGSTSAQDVETKYLRLQEAYSQRLLDLEQSYKTQQRELLNKFILALVRTEQTYREQGDLEGVIMTRELRESLLENPKNLQADDDWPPHLSEMFTELLRLREETRKTSQQKLNELNQVLLNTLEPYKAEFTRKGNLEKALEIRDLQEQLSRGLGNQAAAGPTPSF